MIKNIIIIPTYNEKNNIVPLIDQVRKLLFTTDILFVDDYSPDKTYEVIERCTQSNTKKDQNNLVSIFLLLKKEREGFSKAYISGFSWAIERGYSRILQMDADLSHPIEKIPEFFSALNTHDVVIGSRYIQGGGTLHWNFIRRLISSLGNIYAKYILWLPFFDITGGMNGWKKEALMAIHYENINCQGYSFQIELKWRAWKKKLSMIEIPIIFKERVLGASKMSRRIVFEALVGVLKLRLKKI